MRKKWKISAAAAAGAIALTAGLTAPAFAQSSPPSAHTAHPASAGAKPTVVLIHGAFEDASGWSGEVTRLQRDGYTVVAPALPLRGVATDSAYVSSLVRTIEGPVVLVGHSYGGEVATEVAASDPQQIRSIVYVAAFIPQAGESGGQLDAQFPGSLLGADTTHTVALPDGGTDLYANADTFQKVFAADRSAAQAAEAAATQRPIASGALAEPVQSGVPAGIPLYAVVASHDMAIPPAAERFEAERAGAKIITLDAAHDVDTSRPADVTALIERAAR